MRITRENRSQISGSLKILIWIVILLLVFVLVIVILDILGLIPKSDAFDFLSGLLAGIFGILIGFSLNRISEEEKDKQTKDDFLKLIREELITIKSRISSTQKNEILLLYSDVWNSMVSSGVMRLLNAKQVLQLSRVYTEIKETSFEAERVRLSRDEFENSLDSATRAKFSLNLNRYKDRVADLSKLIDEVLKEEWLTQKQISQVFIDDKS